MDENQKEFFWALSTILFLAFAASLTFLSFSSSTDFTNIFYLLNAGLRNFRSYSSYGVWLYLPFASTMQLFGFAVAFLPSLIFSFIIRAIAGRRAGLLAAFGLPFILMWDNIAQAIAALFLILGLALWLNRARIAGLCALSLASLSHRYAPALALLILPILYLPIEECFSLRALQAAVAACILLSLASFTVVLFIFGSAGAPCQLFSRQTFLIILPIWVLFLAYASKKFLAFFVIFFLICAGMLFLGIYDQPQRRLVYILEAICILGIAFSKAKISWQALAFIFLCSLFLLSLRAWNESTQAFEYSPNPAITAQLYQTCDANLIARLTLQKIESIRHKIIGGR